MTLKTSAGQKHIMFYPDVTIFTYTYISILMENIKIFGTTSYESSNILYAREEPLLSREIPEVLKLPHHVTSAIQTRIK